MIKRFMIYGLIGWCLEVAYTGLGQLIISGDLKLKATTSIWMFFIYGLAVFLEKIHTKLRSWPIFLRGGIYCILIFSTEYTTGYILRETLDACPWKYTSPHAINGLIQLDFIPIWFALGLLFEKFHDKLDSTKYVEKSTIILANSTSDHNSVRLSRMKRIIAVISQKIKPKRPDSNTG